jgi:hypothetical protein
METPVTRILTPAGPGNNRNASIGMNTKKARGHQHNRDVNNRNNANNSVNTSREEISTTAGSQQQQGSCL